LFCNGGFNIIFSTKAHGKRLKEKKKKEEEKGLSIALCQAEERAMSWAFPIWAYMAWSKLIIKYKPVLITS
jgi:hypothetical protein